ncbi:MAG: HAMP domain-containing protein, partial [Terracidiphilus sp.]
MKNRIFFKLVLVFTLVIAAATLTLDIAITQAWESSLRQQIEGNLRQKTAMFALAVSVAPLSNTNLNQTAQRIAQSSGARATVIDSGGLVLADSGADAEKMENHARRPEFQAALDGRVGMDTRHSHTLGTDFLYIAQPVPGGAVRLAVPLSAIADANRKVWRSLIFASALACFIAVLLAGWASRSVSARLGKILEFAGKIAEGDFSARLSEYENDEIGRVATALDVTARKLETSFQQVENSRSELEAVLNSMQEPVVAVSSDGHAQWANRRMEM